MNPNIIYTQNESYKKNPWDKLPKSNYYYIMEVFCKILNNEIGFINDITKEKIINFISTVKGNINFYLVTVDSLRDLWINLREFDDLLDFILKVNTTLRFFIGADAWGDLCTNVSDSISMYKLPDSFDEDSNCTDIVFLKNVVSKTDAMNLISNNSWLITLFLLSMIDRLTIKQLSFSLFNIDESTKKGAPNVQTEDIN